MAVILISGCLIGINCKYDGKNNRLSEIDTLKKLHTLIPACPEQLGGLLTPRKKAEISQKDLKVYDEQGVDLTLNFTRGAEEFLYLANFFKAKVCILKEKSPSCGVNFIYDGTFQNKLVSGKGITATLLQKNNIKIFSEREISGFLLR